MPSDKILNIGRLHCPVEYLKESLFFSLVDYRNNYFTSDDPNKVIEFYNSFENRDQLIQWMRERPKGVATINEVEGEKDVIIVIPTADFNGQYAIECRENIFKDLHIVFVESGGREDFYFNIAHNFNVGIRKAMEYNPKWVVFSGDDMYKIDEVSILRNQLTKLDNNKIDLVFTKKSAYHSIPARFSKQRITRQIILKAIWKRKFGGSLLKPFFDIEKKFQCEYFLSQRTGFTFLLYKKGYILTSFTDFGLFSSEYIRRLAGIVFDETFVNAQEDHDFILRAFLRGIRLTRINYKIGDYVGRSMGTGFIRTLRELAGIAYLNQKWASIFSNSKSLKKD